MRTHGVLNSTPPTLANPADAISAAYYKTLKTHEQWCTLISTPLTFASPAAAHYKALKTQEARAVV